MTKMLKYPKMQTVFLRDPSTKYKKLLLGEYARPEFEYLANCQWVWTEKVDGTNIRVDWDGERVVFGGRTDNAQIPAFLVTRLTELFSSFGELSPMTLFGEGYGAKIQKGGGNYKSDGCDFVLFDVFCGMWLRQGDVRDIATLLGVEVVPLLGRGTLLQLVDFVKSGPKSTWGDFVIEGVVARPYVDLLDRRGDRVITKLKVKDFGHV